MDRNKNIYQVESGRDQSYIKLELDISAVDGSAAGKARLHVYRAGYKDTDKPAEPLKTFEISSDVINNSNKNAEHVIEFHSIFDRFRFRSMETRPSRLLPRPRPVEAAAEPPMR